mmetsp:Transcript_7210/g.10738  ORF Transcript_7210/g.10738 Transcript_7210/m.10738 type:complete len:87 (+) Transcript_7210:290-550(+)
MSDQERDWKLGGIQSMLFFIVGGPASLIAGYLADTVGRRNLLIMVFTMMGGVPCVCTYFVQNFASYEDLCWLLPGRSSADSLLPPW